MKKAISLMVATLIYILSFQAVPLFADDSKDVILVLDTSLSMVGYGGKNIFDRVKGSIAKYIDKLEDGDRVTFMTFDTKIRVYPTVLVDDDNDRDILKKYILMTEARGQWTHTFRMIQGVFKEADDLKKTDDEDRQTVIVVMTDGIDDPPPGFVREKFSIEEIASKYSGKNWWVYLINFKDIKKSGKAEKIQKELKAERKITKELAKVTEHVKIIESDKPEQAIEESLPDEVRKTEEATSFNVFPWIIALLVIGLAGLIIVVLKKLAEVKVSGKLEYWNNEVLKPYIENFDMTRFMDKQIVIGKGVGCHLNLRDFEIRTPFAIRAVRHEKEIKLEIQHAQDTAVEFKNRESGGFLQDGDIFQVNNYTFKYIKTQ